MAGINQCSYHCSLILVSTGTPINKGPSIGSKDLNLYKLFKVVQKLGGYNKVCSHFKSRARAGIRQWLKKTKIGSRKIKLAQEKSNWLKPPKSTTFRIHCASIIKRSYIRGLRVFSKYFSSICVKMSVDDRGIHNANWKSYSLWFPSQVWHQLISPEAVSTGHSIYNAYVIGDHV